MVTTVPGAGVVGAAVGLCVGTGTVVCVLVGLAVVAVGRAGVGVDVRDVAAEDVAAEDVDSRAGVCAGLTCGAVVAAACVRVEVGLGDIDMGIDMVMRGVVVAPAAGALVRAEDPYDRLAGEAGPGAEGSSLLATADGTGVGATDPPA